MRLATLIGMLTDVYASNGDVSVYIDSEYPISELGMDSDGTLTINRDTGAVGPTPLCESCGHSPSRHQEDGCWFTVAHGKPGRDLVCPCVVKP